MVDFTYFLPVIPFIVAWDGWVSHLRAYTPDELVADDLQVLGLITAGRQGG